MIRLGVDTGGTFTDLVKLDGGVLTVHKVRSTPDDPARAILAGIADLIGGAGQAEIVHGSTVATNAVLERKGARVGLVATAGFEDVPRIGRQTRRELYNFFVEAPQPLVGEGLTIGVNERIAADGGVLQSLSEEELERLPERLRELRVESVAVCLLHSYANPVHERRIAEALERAGFTVSASHRVLPEYREVERWSTTLVNAYVTPLMARYLTHLESSLGEDRLRIMQSNGGSISVGRAKAAAVETVLSGPAAGAVGAMAIAKASGHPRAITLDMGGTSTDVSLLDGEIGRTMEARVGDFPVRLPMIDIHSVGAGGGSIAYIDSGGSLRVGPRSAGADPGPVCYGQGSELTVTDANLLLGRLDADAFFGGRMKLDTERTLVVARRLASQLNLTVTALAEGIVRVVNSNMERAIRVVSVQRGFDPREFALLAFGGAGGLHACEIADALDMKTVLVPGQSGVLSALGMLMADVTRDYSQTILKPGHEVSDENLRGLFHPLTERARAELAAEGFEASGMAIECGLDVRYLGQSYEIPVPFTPQYRVEFDRRHERLYGYANARRIIEIVNLRVTAAGIADKPSLPAAEAAPQPLSLPVATRPTIFGGRRIETPVYRREALGPGMTGHGPALLAGAHSTTLIPPRYRFFIDGVDTLVASRTTAEGLKP